MSARSTISSRACDRRSRHEPPRRAPAAGIPWAPVGILLVGVVAVGLRAGLRRVVVEGTSMVPALVPGERLLVVRLPRRWPVRPGQLVAAADPRDPGRLLVKRVAAVDGDGIRLLGDNPEESTDSRTFGAVERRTVWGRAWYRYAPPDRAGRL
ncbi:MAG: nickel-type superoxide dismutase maturation protease [Acidimicrobiales bacterium]